MLIDAVVKVSKKVKSGELNINKINEKVFRKQLYLETEPDLIIRTGGEKRLSNFLSFQSAYSEYMFIDKMWPEFSKEDFLLCVADYNRRKRKFGK